MPKWPSLFNSNKSNATQLELPVERLREPDRNFAHGGRSFYFFDFDDNVAFLTTPIFLFHKETGAEIKISSRELAEQSAFIGKSGIFADYKYNYDEAVGSFRQFRDKDINWVGGLLGRKQMFVTDLAAALGMPEVQWKGPSWSCFYHAVFNSRPLALITARGHHPETIREGISLWVREGHLTQEPNYLAIYPVSHPEIKKNLNLPGSESIPLLKQKALRASVLQALKIYGNNPHHRFGMSDDDPRNIEWIVQEMRVLKQEFPAMSFFIIQTHGEQMVKLEVFADSVRDSLVGTESQMRLFDE